MVVHFSLIFVFLLIQNNYWYCIIYLTIHASYGIVTNTYIQPSLVHYQNQKHAVTTIAIDVMSNSYEATQGVVDKKKEEEGLDNKQKEERQ